MKFQVSLYLLAMNISLAVAQNFLLSDITDDTVARWKPGAFDSQLSPLKEDMYTKDGACAVGLAYMKPAEATKQGRDGKWTTALQDMASDWLRFNGLRRICQSGTNTEEIKVSFTYSHFESDTEPAVYVVLSDLDENKDQDKTTYNKVQILANNPAIGDYQEFLENLRDFWGDKGKVHNPYKLKFDDDQWNRPAKQWKEGRTLDWDPRE